MGADVVALMAKRVDLKSVRADAVFCYTWSRTADEERRMLCLLADVSSEAVFCRWHQLQPTERIALRAAMAAVMDDHYESESTLALRIIQTPADDVMQEVPV